VPIHRGEGVTMARKSFLAILVGAAALAAPSAFADQGGIPHDGSNGQGRPADQTQAQAKTQGKALAKGHAKTHAKAQAKGHAKTHGSSQASTHGKALAKGHAKTQGSSQAAAKGQAKVNTHANAGKTTFCHATGSKTNPYVTITTSNNALPAHTRHQDGRDIIPAPAGGCPGATESSSQQPPAGGEQGNMNTPQGTTQTPAGSTPASGTQGQAGVLGESTTSPAGSNGSNGSPNEVNVLGASTGSAPSASNSPSATGTQASSSSGLPFTGTDAIIVAILGLAALLLGVTARRATTNRV
jgi:hypothetical protein